ncbi:MAG TPA: S1 RNA-binding domain-containing protein [Chloroflexota bacterium]|nr:S1 RNA-binding domain-containing protein [Chloroflexota bacterium]
MDQGDNRTRVGDRSDPDNGTSRNLPVPADESDRQSGENSPANDAASELNNGGDSSMQNLLHEYESEMRTPRTGEVIDGIVVSVDRDGILVDVGRKSEGLIPAHEALSLLQEGEAPEVGEQVLVYVVHPENQDGHVVLSLNRARSERGWRTVQHLADDGSIFEAEVVDFNRGGLIVAIDGVRGFVPMSQIVSLRHDEGGSEAIEDRLQAMIGQRLWLKIIEFNRRRNRLILSERVASQERRSVRKDELLEELKEGEVRRGRVSSICEFGAFVDVGGADGLVHLSELSWSPVQNPEEIVRVGDEIDVMVLNVNRERKKIALSIRRTQPEPWARIAEKYQPGDIVTGTVTKLTTFGAFARIEDGVEGLIHISEMGAGHIVHPRNAVTEGETRRMRILRVEPERRRLGLSLRDIDEDVTDANENADDDVADADENNDEQATGGLDAQASF